MDAIIEENFPNFEIVDIGVEFANNAMRIKWSTKTAGFGTTTFYLDQGQLCCDNEAMSKNFLKTVMSKFIDIAKLEKY